MNRYLRGVFVIAGKDLRSELRTKETINASLAFAVVALLLFSFAYDPSGEQTREFAAGLLWIVFSFSSTLLLNRSFARELPNDCLDALISSPLSGAQLFLGKCIANFFLLLLIEVAAMMVFGLFYNIPWFSQAAPLALVAALATWALTAVGTVFSALTVNLRLRELMLPVLVYPMIIPALMAAIQLTGLALNGQPLGGENFVWFKVLIGFDIIFTALSIALMDIVLVG